jgi:hypothetical protein
MLKQIEQTATRHMCNTTKVLGFVLRALFGIPVLLMCSCAAKPVKHYTLASPGPPQPAQEAIFKVSEKIAMKPFVKIDGHYFSVGSELEHTVVDGLIRPTSIPPLRSLDVRLSPGRHKVDVAISYLGSWSLPFSKGKSISFEAQAGKTYELKFHALEFNNPPATGYIEWETRVIEVAAGKEGLPDPASPGQL